MNIYIYTIKFLTCKLSNSFVHFKLLYTLVKEDLSVQEFTTEEKLLNIYALLRERFGHRDWWPGEMQFEVVVGAILTQRTSWRNVEKAIDNLAKSDAISPQAIIALTNEDLNTLILPSGFYRQKTKRLKRISSFLLEYGNGDFEKFDQIDTIELRRKLLEINGIGPETADSILLYAFHRPVFVVDAYTDRVFSRLALVESGLKYDNLQKYFVENLPVDVALYNDYHAQIVALCKHHCLTCPKCGDCPLVDICKTGQAETNND